MRQVTSFNLSAKTIGYAINLLLLFQTSQGFSTLAETQLGDTQFRAFYQWPLTIALVGTLLFLGWRGYRRSFSLSFRNIVLATLFILLGILCIAGEVATGIRPSIFVRIAAICFGAGLGLSFALWQRLLAASGIEQARSCIIVGTALASIADIALLQMVDPYFLIAAMALLALANAFCLVRHLGQTESCERNATGTLSAPGLLVSIWRSVLCVGVIGFASRTSQALAVEVVGVESMGVYLACAMLVSALAMVVFWFWHGSFSLRHAFTILSALVTASFVSLLFLPAEALPFVAAFAFFSFSIVSMLMVVATIEIADSRESDPTFVFGIFTGLAYLCTDAGPLLTSTLENQLGLSPIAVVSVTGIYLISIAGLALNLAKGTGKEKEPEQSSEDEQPVDLSNSFIRPVIVQQDLIPLCCQQLKKQYQLTVRETEILELLARGRDLSRMAEVLFVSQNTVRSHSRNLYRKLNVHSKQEALDLLEQTRESLLQISDH